jgi:hypothetical protein
MIRDKTEKEIFLKIKPKEQWSNLISIPDRTKYLGKKIKK